MGTILQSVFVSHDVHTFEEYLSVKSVECPSIWVCLLFFTVSLRLYIFDNNMTEVMCPFHCIMQGVGDVDVSYGSVNLNHLIKVVSAGLDRGAFCLIPSRIL